MGKTSQIGMKPFEALYRRNKRLTGRSFFIETLMLQWAKKTSETQSEVAGTLNSYQLIIDSLDIRFLHIKQYELDYKWQASHRTLHHSVMWIVQQGSFLLEVDHIRYTCKEGQICILPAHTAISYHAISSELALTSINFDAEISLLSNRSWGMCSIYPSYSIRHNTMCNPRFVIC